MGQRIVFLSALVLYQFSLHDKRYNTLDINIQRKLLFVYMLWRIMCVCVCVCAIEREGGIVMHTMIFARFDMNRSCGTKTSLTNDIRLRPKHDLPKH